MFLLVTGASGMGKSTVRRLVAPRFDGVLDDAEIALLSDTPQWEIAWRHRVVEKLVRRALDSQAAGRHFLLCGDPVPPGEVLAAPSADALDGLAVCLLDASADEQRRRLVARGDPAELLPNHLAFADWMREHVLDPRHRPEVLRTNAWEAMRWERLYGPGADPSPWTAHRIDTTGREPRAVADEVAAWIRDTVDAAPP